MMPTYPHNPFSPPPKALSGVDYSYDVNGSHSRTNYPQGYYMDYYGYFYVNIPVYQGNIIGVYCFFRV